VLDDSGLKPAIETLVARVASMNGLDVRLDLDLAYERGEEPTRLSAEVEETLYRVVQEALTNVIKHANASTVKITVVERGGRVDVRVADDGIGIQPDGATVGGFGLIGIRERLELVGGSFALDAGEPGGTELRAGIPASRASDQASQSV
jgi:signal transduction histidine kinase